MPHKFSTPKEAAALIQNGNTIWTHSMGASPSYLYSGLYERAQQLNDLTLLQLHTENSGILNSENLKGRLRHQCYFVGAETRKLIQEGHADYVPIFLSEIPKIFRRGEQKIDVALIQVSPPDKHGLCTLGISVEATRAACDVAPIIIAHINPRMPRTHGDAFIPYERLTAVVEHTQELPEHPYGEVDEISKKIGNHIAQLIDDGSCLQMGIGSIPDAVLSCLNNHKNLGIHTEMFSDGAVDLIKSGVINGANKKVHRNKVVTGFVLGTRKVYDFVDDNPEVVFLDIEYVNDTQNIRRNPKTVSINSALEIDITGQICADSIGTKIYSGVGGQVDFVRGAALSEGGKAIIAFPSTAANGKISRIKSLLTPGAGVITTRAHAQYIVTEFGVAYLSGKSIKERAKALINIAHPKFQEQLNKETFEIWGIRN